MNVLQPVVHIVDDDASFLDAMSRLLRASGFLVKVFSTAGEFLKQHDDEVAG